MSQNEILSGKEFHERFKNERFIKLTNESENHNNFQFQTGLNEDFIPFFPCSQCSPGGIYFTDIKLAYMWFSYSASPMKWYRYVTLPDDAKVYIESYKYKADKLILGERNLLSDLPNYYDHCIKIIDQGNFSRLYLANLTPELCLYAVQKSPYNFPYIPIEFQTIKICKLAVQGNPKNLNNVCDRIKNDPEFQNCYKNIASSIVLSGKDGLWLQYIDPEKQTGELCRRAVENNAYALVYVAPQYKTSALCENAVSKNPYVLKYVDAHLQTPESCLEVIKNKYSSDRYAYYLREQNKPQPIDKTHIFQYIAHHILTEEFCLETLCYDGLLLKYIPAGNQTEKICLAAVKKNGLALEYVLIPQTLDICSAAYSQNENSIRYAKIKTLEMTIIQLKKYPHELKNIPPAEQFEAACTTAVKQNGITLQYVADHFHTLELSLDSLTNNPYAIEFVKPEYRTAELLLRTVQCNGLVLKLLKPEEKTSEILLAAVEQNGYAIEYIPKELRTDTLLYAAAKQNGYSLKFMDQSEQTAYICLTALSQNKYAMKFVKVELPEGCIRNATKPWR